MKKSRRILTYTTALLLLIMACSSCKKTDDSSNGPSNTTTSVTYVNNTFEPVNITVNGQSQVIGAGSAVVYKGTSGTPATGAAYTYGRTTAGNQVGGKVSWTINDIFPQSGNYTNDLNVPSSVFFLKLINKSAYQILSVYVNYGLTSQSLDNITVPNDGNLYNIGFYNAYSNSNVRAQNGNIFWTWTNLNLTGSANQAVTITAF